MKDRYDFLEHTADIKFRAYGKNLAEVYENSALALSEVLSRGEEIKSKKKKKFEIVGNDNESLLYRFLDELLYLLDAEDFIVSSAKVMIEQGGILKAEVFGDSASNYNDLDHVKAATYAEMYVKEIKKSKWEAQVVLDV